MQTRKAQLKRAYSILSNAITRHRAENGVTDYWTYLKPEGDGKLVKNTEALYELLKPYVKDTVKCSIAEPDKGECKFYSLVSSFDGTNTTGWFGELGSGFVLGGGMTFSRECIYAKNVDIHVDVNGIQGPNRYGMDMFIFNLSKEGVLSPANGYTPEGRGGCSDFSVRWGGGGCTHKALYDENYWKNPAMK